MVVGAGGFGAWFRGQDNGEDDDSGDDEDGGDDDRKKKFEKDNSNKDGESESTK